MTSVFEQYLQPAVDEFATLRAMVMSDPWFGTKAKTEIVEMWRVLSRNEPALSHATSLRLQKWLDARDITMDPAITEQAKLTIRRLSQIPPT